MKILILLIFSCLLFSCHGKKGNFSVAAPEGWIILDTLAKDNSQFVAMHAPVESTIPIMVENINIGILRYSNVDNYINDLYDRIKSEAFYFHEKGSGSITINDHKMKWKQYIMQRDKDSELAEQKTYFVGYKGNIYQIVCNAGSNGIKVMQNKIDLVSCQFDNVV